MGYVGTSPSIDSSARSSARPRAAAAEEAVHKNDNHSHATNDTDIPKTVEKEEEAIHSQPNQQLHALGWKPFRRYYRRSTASIEMGENQFFIPPPEEGTTLFESLFYTINGYGNDFVVWIYEAKFFTVLAMFFFAYYALVFSFAGILVAMESRTGGRCGLEAYETWTKSYSFYELAFELSWTTFTTVGYGIVSPSGEDSHCYPIRFLCSMFAFMGLLFNSLSAAIFFSKLERVLTRSSVTFSSSVCLQFGQAASFTRGSKGVYGQFWTESNSMRSLDGNVTDASRSNRSISTADSDGARGPPSRLGAIHDMPYPFLEFRIVNDHANYKNRAVRNAHVNAMVQLSALDAENARAGLLDRRRSSKATFREYVSVVPKDSPVKDAKKPRPPSIEESDSLDSSFRTKRIQLARSNRRQSLGASIIATALIVQESDHDKGKGSGLEGRVYYPLNLEPQDHPYFRHVFYIRHVLNDRSPLLKPCVREKIKRDGCWDTQRNQHQDILSSLVDFHSIRITFKGTSSVSNALVFAQKVYNVEDVYVGWQFGQIFYQKERGWFRRLCYASKTKQEGDDHSGDEEKLMLDKRLIHDILPQAGGGHEPIEG